MTSARNDICQYIAETGYMYGMGNNAYSQLGIVDPYVWIPQRESSLSADWASVKIGNAIHIARKTDNTLWTCGEDINSAGTHGRGAGEISAAYTVFTQIGTDTDWAFHDITEHSCFAIKQGGTLYAWGENLQGQLGLGDIVNRDSPVQVGVATTWASVTSAGQLTYGLQSDGTLWRWGRYWDGVSAFVVTNTPTQLGTDTDWQSISAAHDGGAFIKTDGTLWVDGYNAENRFTNAFTLNDWIAIASGPVQVGTDTDWINVELGGTVDAGIGTTLAFMLARKAGGAIYSVGSNGNQSPATGQDAQYGWLGVGDSLDRTALTQVGIDTDWTNIFATAQCAFYIKSNGELWGAGSHYNGAMGQGEFGSDSYLSPLLIASSVTSLGDAAVPIIPSIGTALLYPDSVQSFALTLTGAEDATTDINLPMNNFSYRERVSGTRTLSASIPWTTDHAAAVFARPNGQLVINHSDASGTTEIIRVNLDTIRQDIGGRNASITLAAEQNYSAPLPTVYTITDIESERWDSVSAGTWTGPYVAGITAGDYVVYSNSRLYVQRLAITASAGRATITYSGEVT